MCKFFSFITLGDGKPVYFDLEARKAGLAPYGDADSHSIIAAYFNLNVDKVNKYEADLASFTVDQINIEDDSTKAKAAFEKMIASGEFDQLVLHHGGAGAEGEAKRTAYVSKLLAEQAKAEAAARARNKAWYQKVHAKASKGHKVYSYNHETNTSSYVTNPAAYKFSLPFKMRDGEFRNSTGKCRFNPFSMEARSYIHWQFVAKVRGKVIFNNYSYSPTTGRHQRTVARLLRELGIKVDLHVNCQGSLDDSSAAAMAEHLAIANLKVAMKTGRKAKNVERAKEIKAHELKIKQLRKLGLTATREQLVSIRKLKGDDNV